MKFYSTAHTLPPHMEKVLVTFDGKTIDKIGFYDAELKTWYGYTDDGFRLLYDTPLAWAYPIIDKKSEKTTQYYKVRVIIYRNMQFGYYEIYTNLIDDAIQTAVTQMSPEIMHQMLGGKEYSKFCKCVYDIKGCRCYDINDAQGIYCYIDCVEQPRKDIARQIGWLECHCKDDKEKALRKHLLTIIDASRIKDGLRPMFVKEILKF